LDILEKSIRNTWKVLKCDAEKGRKRSVGPIVWEMKVYKESRQRGIAYRKANWIGDTYCVGTVF